MNKKKKEYDIIIIGNGSIGILSAFLLKIKHPKKKIAILGKQNFAYAASMAAGAMHNVYCEVESNFYQSTLEQSNFEMGIKSRHDWKKIFNRFNLNKVITADDTFLYLKKGFTDFEKNNFEVACDVANKDNVLKKASKHELENFFNGKINSNNFKCVKINGEFGFNPNLLIHEILKLSSKIGIDIIFQEVKKIVNKKNTYLIDKEYHAKKLVIAAGYGSYEVGKNIFNPVPIVKGVGTAFILQDDYFKKIKSVVRTSNRGGAQCGLHMVPYDRKNGKIYIGAGNYISEEKEPWARTETIKYLIKLLEDELIPQSVIYKSKITTLLGYRPRSVDNRASIGGVNENLFYVSGTYRAGLTWASYIANQVVSWSNGDEPDSLLKEYKPDRKIKTWGSIDEACKYYASSRVSNLIEHNLINKKNLSKKYKQLYVFAKNKNLEIIKKKSFDKDFVVDPDCYSYYEN
jgi:glycine oxidase